MTKSNDEILENEIKLLLDYNNKLKQLLSICVIAMNELPEVKICLLEIEQKEKEEPSWELSDIKDKFTSLWNEINAEIQSYEVKRDKLMILIKKQVEKVKKLQN